MTGFDAEVGFALGFDGPDAFMWDLDRAWIARASREHPIVAQMATHATDENTSPVPGEVREMLRRADGAETRKRVSRRALFRSRRHGDTVSVQGVLIATRLAIHVGAFAQLNDEKSVGIAPFDVGIGTHLGIVARGKCWQMVIAPMAYSEGSA